MELQHGPISNRFRAQYKKPYMQSISSMIQEDDEKILQSVLYRLQYILEVSNMIPSSQEALTMLQRELGHNLSAQKWTKIIKSKITEFVRLKHSAKSSTNTYLLLPAHRLLNAFDDNEINNDLFDKILNVIGNRKEIINHLINSIHPEKTKQIINILQTEKNNKDIKNDKINMKQSCFDGLAASSISNICEFLTKYDIKTFKLSSVNIGISCLQIMKKYKLSVFNMNELLYIPQYKYSLNLHGNDVLKSNWYYPNTKTSIFKNIWSKRYNIPLQHMMISASNIKWAKLTKVYQQSHVIKQINHFADISFMIFDKRKIIVINNNNSKILSSIPNHEKYDKTLDEIPSISKFQCLRCDMFDGQNSQSLQTHLRICNKFQTMNKNNITILQYFDIFNQQLNAIQFIQIDGELSVDKLYEYIQFKLGSYLSHQSLSWHNKLLYIINKMKQYQTKDAIFKLYVDIVGSTEFNPTSSGIRLFGTKQINTMNEVDNAGNWKCNQCNTQNRIWNQLCLNCNNSKGIMIDIDQTLNAKQKCIIFQLNDKHSYFIDNKIEIKSKPILKSNQLEPPIYFDVLKYIKDSNTTFRIFVQYFRGDTIFKQHILNASNTDISHKFEYMATELTTSGKLREKIASSLNNIVEAYNIEIFTNIGDEKRFNWGSTNNITINKWHESIGKCMYWEIVTYDTRSQCDEKKMNDENMMIYQVQIFVENEKKPICRLPVKYNATFKVKDFIKHIFKTTENILYNNSFEPLTLKYGKDDNIGNIDGEYSFILMETEEPKKKYNLFKYYDIEDIVIFNPSSNIKNISIYIGKNFKRKIGNTSQIPLIVRFCVRNQTFSSFDLFDKPMIFTKLSWSKFKSFERPKKIWIDKMDTINNIIEIYKKCDQYSFADDYIFSESYIDHEGVKNVNANIIQKEIEGQLLKKNDIVSQHLKTLNDGDGEVNVLLIAINNSKQWMGVDLTQNKKNKKKCVEKLNWDWM